MSDRPLSDRLCECGCGQRTPLAQRTDSKRGIRRGDPVRFIQGHQGKINSPRSMPDDEIVAARRAGERPAATLDRLGISRSSYERAFQRAGVQIGNDPEIRYGGNRIEHRWEERDMGFESPCWVWLLGSSAGDYGYTHDQAGGRSVTAHAFNWIERYGPVPAGKELHHRCEVKNCVNPDHLQPVTRSEHLQIHRSGQEVAV